ncbi:flagellar biosynthesis anti-sigma factor FlgM [Pseudomaricurvus alcaniphilus]|uniref:flagellar biosynthesis anti-sigma factor FlgM n=1 Tax=Pseudomaricurvus alcaniphilus TaxID=1166482 RepID=UPI001409781A|nr:flagellar biosynthesis anti-sigma factor FlgM [Pseudomaricurvus alcaniphilus]NHN39467.1 flagellar biosynthesis anti-sigma factor FlgM [Pseudomaricurvus alcaniphilus]
MVIDSNSNIHSSSGSPRNRVDARGTDTKSSSQPESSGSQASSKPDVSLSTQARLLHKLESQISSSPDVNSDRVADIKRAIAEGSYQINPERIAERMLEQDDQF